MPQHLEPIFQLAAELSKYYPARTTGPMPKDFSRRLKRFEKKSIKGKISRLDGIKVFLPDGSLHVRASNTEPIYRVMAEVRTARRARTPVQKALAVLDR